MRDAAQARRTFWVLWVAVLALKLVVAARLPLFVDEAFYWQEGQHLAAAYSDLPGLTAWLTRLGTLLGGDSMPSRCALPFLLIAALVPWLMVHITAREFGERAGWRGRQLRRCCCRWPAAWACWRCRTRRWRWRRCCASMPARACCARSAPEAALELALGLAHRARCATTASSPSSASVSSRCCCCPRGGACCAMCACWSRSRSAHRRGRRWWPGISTTPTPACASSWSIAIPGPSTPTAVWFIVIQALLVTPLLLFAAWCVAARRAWRSADAESRYFALLGRRGAGLLRAGFLRRHRAGQLPLAVAGLPARCCRCCRRCSSRWPRGWRRGHVAGWPALGLVADAGLLPGRVAARAARTQRRAEVVSRPISPAGSRWRRPCASGWRRCRRARAWSPTISRSAPSSVSRWAIRASPCSIIRSTTSTGARRNCDCGGCKARTRRLGRSAGAAGGRRHRGASTATCSTAITQLCAMVGPLPPPQVLNIDHGRQRFMLFALDGKPASGACTTPSMAGSTRRWRMRGSGERFNVHGWAFKDGVGLTGVDITLDGEVVAKARLRAPVRWAQAASGRSSTDPQHPHVGFKAEVDLRGRGFAPGRHWLGLRLHGHDGSVEEWAERPIELE